MAFRMGVRGEEVLTQRSQSGDAKGGKSSGFTADRDDWNGKRGFWHNDFLAE